MAAEFLVTESLELKILTWLASRELINNQCRESFKSLIINNTAAIVPEFVLEDLPLGRTAALVPEFALKDLPLSRTL